MSVNTETLAYIWERNTDGSLDSIINDYEDGKIDVQIIRLSAASAEDLEVLRARNTLGQFDDLIAQADSLVASPLIAVCPVVSA